MLSNASYDVVNQLFADSQARLFDATVLSYNTGYIKPDARIYEAVTKRLGVLPAECVYIDDLQRHCDGAIAVGMQAVLYKNVTQTTNDIAALIHD